MGALKNYILKYTNFDIVVIDYGDIQRFVSLEHGKNLHENRKFRAACLHYLDNSLSDIYVYCKIDAKTALRRMNVRGRDTGRIDRISDQNFKLQELENEIGRFDFWTTVLKERRTLLFDLDMEKKQLHDIGRIVPFITELELYYWSPIKNEMSRQKRGNKKL